MKTIQDELREWLRPCSPLTAFAKSVRNEQGAGQDDASKATKGEYIDPMADFDFADLPTDQQARLKELQTNFKKQYDEKAELESRRLKAEEFARTQQSRADRLAATVQRHNLPADGAPTPSSANSADAKIAAYEKQFLADGLAAPQAAAYAKMFAAANAIERESIMRELAPLAQGVGSVQAQQVLDTARNNPGYKQVFSVPELAKQVNDNVAVLVQQGGVVDDKTVNHLVSMAWGNYALSNPDALKGTKGNDVNQQQNQLPQFRSGVTNGGHVSSANLPTDGAPVATQPETLTIMSNINKFLTADMPKAKTK